jgi:hypothetical protein
LKEEWPLNLHEILEAISKLSGPELDRVRQAADRRSSSARLKQSTVAERRNHASGILQLECRVNPKTGTQRGPYWYFHWREGGQQRSLYLGKTEDPEEALATKLAERNR